MPFADAGTSLIDLRGGRTSASILGSMVVLGVVAYLLYRYGIIDRVFGIFSRIVRWVIRTGFYAWEATFAWASWWALLLIAIGAVGVGFLIVGFAPPLSLVLAGAVTFMGVSACLAYMFIDIERYEVERGYKAVHNPLKGQELAPHLALYGQQVDFRLLISATVATVGGFALLNHGLYETIGQSWYLAEDGDVGFLDFLAYSLLNLLRAVDVLDLARSRHLIEAAFVKPATWQASVLITSFRSFFMLVLLQQIFASIRQGRLLAETIADFWSPHEPIQQRARNALPQYGAAAIGPLLVSLRSVTALTKEQRDQLPQILAAIGPSTIPALLRHLNDPYDHVRAVCALALGHLNAREALPLLSVLTSDPSDHVRLSLGDALGLIAAAAGRTDRVARVRGRQRRRYRWLRQHGFPIVIADPIPLVLKSLRDLLTDDVATVRSQAALGIGRIGKGGEAAIPDLVTRLGDADEVVRCDVATALGAIGGERAMSALIEGLQDPAATVRAAVARGLATFGTAAQPAVEHLLPLLQDSDEAVRNAVADAISRAGPLDESATASLVEGLASPDNVVRAQTAEALGDVGAHAEDAAEALAGVLRDSNDVVRAKAAEALGKIGEAAAEAAVPGLVKALRDRDSWVSAMAAEALGEMGEAADAAVPALVKSLAHVNAQVRANAALALGKLGTDARQASTGLERAATDEEGGVRAQAIRALGLLGANTSRTLALIHNALEDPDPQVREAAVEALSNSDRTPKKIQAVLLSLLNDPNDQVKVQVIKVLARQEDGVEVVVDGFCRLLADDSSWVQVHAALGLAKLGPTAASAGAALVQAARTGDASVREQAMKAIATIQPPEAADAFALGLKDPSAEVRVIASAGWIKAESVPPEAVRGLIDALRDPEVQVRANAAFALSRLKQVPHEAIPLLAECTTDPSDSLRLNAALALRNVPGGVALEVLDHLVDDPSTRVRLVAAGAVLAVNPEHAGARVVVEQALSDPSPRVRQAASELLESLGTPVTELPLPPESGTRIAVAHARLKQIW